MSLLDMKVPEFPNKEFLLHNKAEVLTDEQRIWWDAMVRFSDILSLTMQNSMERTSGRYLSMLFTEFLEKLYRVISVRRKCGKDFIFDDFVNIAVYSVSALKHIVSSPSKRIEKRSEKVLVSQLRHTSSKTMQWMAKRPGRSALEKIAPENKVMTSVTRFSADTKENRESLYLYDILHDIIQDRIHDTDCLSCEYAASCGVPTKSIRDLLALHTRIRHGDLSDVPAEKQAMQNNKLMCDVNYKMVWDAVKYLSRIEDSLAVRWEMLQQRYVQIGFWIILSFVLQHTDSSIMDCYGTLSDDQGQLEFIRSDGEPVKNEIVIYPTMRFWEPITLALNGFELTLRSPTEELLYLDLRNVTSMEYDPEIWSDIAVGAEEEDTGIVDDTPQDTSGDEHNISDSSEGSEEKIITELYHVVAPTVQEPEKPAPEIKKQPMEEPKSPVKSALKVGDTVYLGHFPQTALGNDNTSIEWQVFRVLNDGTAWLISRKLLDRKPIDEKSVSLPWAKTSLFYWLNKKFYEQAFNTKEKKALVEIDGSGALVSIVDRDEAEMYLGDMGIRICAPTEYAISHGAARNKEGFSPYWTRTVDVARKQVDTITGSGNIKKKTFFAPFISVRPYIRIRTAMFGEM